MRLFKVPLLGLLLAWLTACQNQSSYVIPHTPVPPAPTQPMAQFDRSAYPVASRDFAQYRNWHWLYLPSATAWASAAEIQQAVSEALDQRGLRPQLGNAPSDLQVSVELRLETRERQVVDNDYDYGRPYPYSHGYPYEHRAWGYGPRIRTYREEVWVLQINLYGSQNQQLLWSGRAETAASQSQASEDLAHVINQALADYPPDH